MLPALVEGHLEARLLAVLWRQLGKHETRLVVRNAGGSPFWKHAKRYNEAGKFQTVIGLGDLEQSACAEVALAQLENPLSVGFKLRLAVRMIESWLMADRESFAEHLGLRVSQVPAQPDLIAHPKLKVVELARQSRKRSVRQALVPAGAGAVGAEYMPFMAGFVDSHWQQLRARVRSPSLERACTRWAAI